MTDKSRLPQQTSPLVLAEDSGGQPGGSGNNSSGGQSGGSGGQQDQNRQAA